MLISQLTFVGLPLRYVISIRVIVGSRSAADFDPAICVALLFASLILKRFCCLLATLTSINLCERRIWPPGEVELCLD